MNKLNIWLIVLACGTSVTLSLSLSHYKNKAEKQGETITRLTDERDAARSAASMQAFKFQRFNEIAASASQYGISLKATTEEKQREYRTIIKQESCAAQFVPDAVADRVLKYAEDLRAGAVLGTTAIANGANAGAVTTRRLTYAQAVLWLDSLLATIDNGNKRFEAIRAADGVRSNEGKERK
ncbi:DUF2570 domain-containing protein [Serratia marcescens]|uniref:DUF2570 domain-containing protein n=1 Tax=Serratia marcescens TaxID=615 RepID=UPI000D8965C4|nr:DUF2570 domain-containing protein [Serratia marcescens]PYA51173.1 hypothetical protein DMW45_03790 [Serratia marcescens]